MQPSNMWRRLFAFLREGSWLARIARFGAYFAFAAGVDPAVTKIWPSIDIFRLVGDDAVKTLLVGITLFLFSELVFFPLTETIREADTPKSESATFAAAVLRFAQHLKATRRYGPLLVLRENVSHFLHLLRAHEERIELGRLALGAAVEAKSELHRALILLDDLGWAFAEVRDTHQAKRGIEKALAIARASQSTDPLHRGRLGLVIAKGMRHLAMLSRSHADSMEYLRKARQELGLLKADPVLLARLGDDISLDEAQLRHAEATVWARELDLDRPSQPITDAEFLKSANEAMTAAEEAASLFEELGDDERHAKALTLAERIQKKLGHEVDAIETKARIRRVLRVSDD